MRRRSNVKSWMPVISMAACVFAGTALADVDCDDPVASWQSRDTLRQQLESNGWKVKRIRVDDGCYEVHGIDRNGNRFEAKYAPASLEIRELEIRFQHRRGQASDYLDGDATRGGPHNRASQPVVPDAASPAHDDTRTTE